MLPDRQAQNIVKAIAGSLTPETLAAVVADLGENDQCSEYMQGLADFAKRQFRRQLVGMVGETDAAMMLADAASDVVECACPGCGESRHDMLVWDADGELVTCSTCGCEHAPACTHGG